MSTEIEDILKIMGEENAKKFESARKQLEEKKKAERDRKAEMEALDKQIHDEAVQKQLAKQQEPKPSKTLQLLKDLIKAVEEEEEAKKHMPIDGL